MFFPLLSNFFLCPLGRQITKSVTSGNFERVRKRRRRKMKKEEKGRVEGNQEERKRDTKGGS